MAELQKGKIIFDRSDWMAGLHPNYSLAITDTPIPSGDKLATAMSSFNPFRQGGFGYAAPGYAAQEATNSSLVSTSPMRRIELAFDTGDSSMHAFGIDSDTKLYRMDANTGEIESGGVWPHTVTAASGTVELNDICVYTSDVGANSAQRVFYSYNRVGANAWDIGMYALDGSTFDDNFMSSVPTNPIATTTDTNPHPMLVGDDDVLYFGDGNTLYGYDGVPGANGEVFTALVLPKTFRIQSFAKLNQRFVIFGYFQPDPNGIIDNLPSANTVAKVYFWDYLSLDPYDSVDLSDAFVSCAIQFKGTIGCFTQGRPGSVGSLQPAKLQFYDGNVFKTVTTFDSNGSITQNALPLNGAYDVLGDCIVWNSLGTVYQFGPPYPGADSKLFKSVQGAGGDSGALRILDQTTVVFSNGTGPDGLVYYDITADDQTFAEGFFRSQLVSPSFPSGMIGKITSIKISFSDISDPDGLDLVLGIIGNNTPYTVVNQFAQVTDTSIISEFYYSDAGEKLPFFNDICVTFDWTGSIAIECPIPESVEIYYELINDTVTA